ncbi:LexA family transcriptional regulator [Hungatella hathewayi]|uniref:LexA family transcriptional regulator n=1 Tax=Hungatella hathewayi TaxID=154046 RepID=A0A3E2WWH6_9FIRM|nr:S24 family peptidase [Hungatella hathewayi]RGC31523.1 LexA family transcriptional regulator [Hungatella hathewayi]
MTFGERLIELRKAKGYTRESFAEFLGISKYTLRNYELSVNDPGSSFLKQISNIFNVSIDYLMGLTDEPEVLKNFRLRTLEQDMIVKYRSLDAYGQDTVSYILDREVSRVQQISNAYKDGRSIIEYPTYFMTYYHNLASAGNGEYIFEDLPTDTIEVPANELSERADFIIGVNGDSMEPTYYDGEKVYVEKMQVLEIGDIGIFMINNECFIKEVGEDGLISHNPKYDIISGNENIECIGKVLGKVTEEQVLNNSSATTVLSREDMEAIRFTKELIESKSNLEKKRG